MSFPFNSKSIRRHKSVDVLPCVLRSLPNTFLCQVWHRSGSEQAVPVSGWVSGHPSIPLLCSRRSERPPHWGAALHAGRCSLSTQHTWKGMVHFFFPSSILNTDVMANMTVYGLCCAWCLCFVSQDNVSSLLPVFEEFLKNAPQDASYDSVRQSVVILMGSLAKHLDKNDPKVKPIVAKLITALSTPSQQVHLQWIT